MNIVKLQEIKLIQRNTLHSFTLEMRKQGIEGNIPFTITTK